MTAWFWLVKKDRFSTIFYAIVLAVVFRTWYRIEGTLSIHSITTPRREVFYWAAVLATFALGTGAGDLLIELDTASPAGRALPV